MSSMTKKMSKASTTPRETEDKTPKKGERFRCEKCGMELQVTVACSCQDAAHVHLYCCGEELQKV